MLGAITIIVNTAITLTIWFTMVNSNDGYSTEIVVKVTLWTVLNVLNMARWVRIFIKMWGGFGNGPK